MLNTGYILDGKYEIINILGSGGMGTVYFCRNNRLGNLWAIKEVLSEWKDKINFLAEPSILKNLNHPGIPRIIDIFYENDNLYMVEDYIDGKNLKELIEKDGCLAAEKIKSIALQLCDILGYLHSFSPPIIYRDLKPSNIMLKTGGNIVLVDFGIARTYKKDKENDTLLFGSKGYMAPEQLHNVQSNIQTDVYSLGATLYFLATGKTMLSSDSTQNDAAKAQNFDVNLKQVIDKATAVIPENRFKSMAELKRMLLVNNEDYLKTKFIKAENAMDNTILKTKMIVVKNHKKKLPFLIGGILLLAIALISAYFLLPHNSKKLPASSDIKQIDNTQLKKETQVPKEPVEKDIITRGILYKDTPIILNDNNNNNSKGKGRDKNKEKSSQNYFHLLFTLNPAASISNSKINITVNSIELINSVSILDINIDNKTNEDVIINLNKTYLFNGNNTSFTPSNISSDSIVAPQNTKQNIKLYFSNFDFEGNSYCFKTNINYGISKDINLFIDVK
jgi:serine/threonine protein kinase